MVNIWPQLPHHQKKKKKKTKKTKKKTKKKKTKKNQPSISDTVIKRIQTPETY